MCILSIYRNGDSYIFTHNRDEYDQRRSSETLVTKTINDHEVTYPVDLQAKGTWVLTSEKWTTAILNGAETVHKHKPPYKQSRGVFPLRLMQYTSADHYFSELALEGIEPFTQIILDNENLELYRLSWNEIEKKMVRIESDFFVISSSTLYSPEKKAFHKRCFAELELLNPDTLAETHKKLQMESNPEFPHVKTTSRVQIVKNVKEKHMNFKNLIIRKQFQ